MNNQALCNCTLSLIFSRKQIIPIIKFIYGILLDLFMTFAPSLNYLFQAQKFKQTKSSKGFSIFLCLVTLLSHTLKVFFWFGKKFKFTLLLQSILVINMQLYLIHLCIKYKELKISTSSVSLLYNNKNLLPNKFKLKNFIKSSMDCTKTLNSTLIWRWNTAIEYYKFYFLIIFTLSALSIYFGINNIYYINVIGIFSVFLEMLCTLPQIIELHKSKNPNNISKIMVFMWFSGNILKIYYNTVNNSPMQLIIGSYIQVFFNIILICQMFYYYFIYKVGELEPITSFDSDEEEEKETSKLKEQGKVIN